MSVALGTPARADRGCFLQTTADGPSTHPIKELAYPSTCITVKLQRGPSPQTCERLAWANVRPCEH
eukprot:7070645-Pyramimonas_sp.AAC.1